MSLNIHFETLSADKILQSYCFNDESSIAFLMQDGTVVTLPYIGNIDCNQTHYAPMGYGAGIYTYAIEGSFSITQEQLNELKGTLRKVRINFAEKAVDLSIRYVLENNKIGMVKIQGDKKMNPQYFFKHFAKCVEPASAQVAQK